MGIFIILSSIALFAAVSSSPLLGTLAAEAALLFGLVFGPFSFIAGVKRGARRDSRGFASDFMGEGAYILAALCLFMLAAFLNAFRFESCAQDKGLFPFLVLVLPVLWIDLVTGIWIGRMIGKSSIALLSSLFLIVCYLGFQLVWWWSAPSLRFFNHHLIVIAGDLLTGQGLSPAITAYRLSTFLFGIALLIFGFLVFKNSTRQRSLNGPTHQSGLFWTAICITIAAFWIQIKSSNDLSPSRSQLNQHYSLIKKRDLLILHADPARISPVEADAILAEGILWFERLKIRTGIKPTKNIHIWLHSDMQALTTYTGARNVHFTLPTHREIHISSVQIPHPTLGHELAHLFIGEESTTLFGLAGVLTFFPNYGLNEGLAVFLTPELAINDDLTVMQQAAAIYRLGYLKDFESLFSIRPWDFWFEPSAKAYIATGAYLEYLIANKTKNSREIQLLVKKLVSAGELYPVWDSEQDHEQFLKNFKRHLQSSPLPEDAFGSARERFRAPSIVYAQCHTTPPIAVSILSDEQTIALLKTTLATSDVLDKRQRGELIEKMGDAFWRMQQSENALQKYNEIDVLSLPIYWQRQIMVKMVFLKAMMENSQISPLAFSVLKLLTATGNNFQTTSAQFGLIGMLIGKTYASQAATNEAWTYSNYLWARHQIMGQNYDSGLSAFYDLISNPLLPPLFYFESRRLMAHAYAMKQEHLLAYDIYLDLKTKDNREASQLILQDFAERALKANTMQDDQWLLGLPPRF